MESGNAPTVSITPKDQQPPKDMARIISRVKNLKLAIAKPTVKDDKRLILQAELDKLMSQVDGLKKDLKDL